jgi:Helicase conserved C-terminal domain
MNERSLLIEWIRGEVVGPSRPITETTLIEFNGRDFTDANPMRSGPLAWRPIPDADTQEVLYFERETPHRKYGCGVLHPSTPLTSPAPDQLAAMATDTLGIDPDENQVEADDEGDEADEEDTGEASDLADPSDDFEVTSPDVRHPSTIGISFCARFEASGQLIIKLPVSRQFLWQDKTRAEFQLNGRYERCIRHWTDGQGQPKDGPMWRRVPAVSRDTQIGIDISEFVSGRVLRRNVEMPAGSPVALRVEVYPRQLQNEADTWLMTVVLRNSSQPPQVAQAREATLYQTYFEVVTQNGSLERYPESQRPFAQLDSDEQSLSLLYRESSTWGIGHGCAAGWDAEPDQVPDLLYADAMPAVQTPSITPDINDSNGNAIRLSMRELAALPDDGQTAAWQPLTKVAEEYRRWIVARREDARNLSTVLETVADRHLDAATFCLRRINRGIEILRNNERARKAFRLANLSMLLQQIATKQLDKRTLQWDQAAGAVVPTGSYDSPWSIFKRGAERIDLGFWRAFQIAFLLMSIDGVINEESADREIVDLIWFPTGGGKTEAYLAVMAFYMFHQRLRIEEGPRVPARDGTNVLMRYTLRMLTTQQFQRAASLICAMEFLRRNADEHRIAVIGGARFSLGLWIGSSASPNTVEQARTEVASFRSGRTSGNPLVLTECPWCRAEIGRYDGSKPRNIPQSRWNALCTRGINDNPSEGPLLLCPDGECVFGAEQWQDWLPIEVIDERIYGNPPSLVIATADKFAIIAYRPAAGALFGRQVVAGNFVQTHIPPGIIVQDELHLISGPLGTIYGLYEGIFERLCSRLLNGKWIKPKLIASTATIRGASEQVMALYARPQTQLFPSPGLLMSDSFFGRYARGQDGRLRPGRLYLGIHANNYGSVLTTQVRVFSSALFRPHSLPPESRDPWWSLLVFYNSIRELGGAKTLFDSDIRSRLKFVFNRENFTQGDRRTLKIVEELTSRLSQAEIVEMMDRMSTAYEPGDNKAFDACLASNIIEVGVDIDRLSLMGVVGQPKTTAQYIQVTGRVGRRWWERPGLILTIYNPSKSRDRSHFEQFHSYHRRLYERVEPTSATPFAISAIKRALPGALLVWARQQSDAAVQNYAEYEGPLDSGYDLMRQRCVAIQLPEDQVRSLEELERVRREVEQKWKLRPLEWEEFPPSTNGEYLILWPGQFATIVQKQRGLVVPSSMRQVDGSAELTITQGY